MASLSSDLLLSGYLSDFIESKKQAVIYLVNGIRLVGFITGYDEKHGCIFFTNKLDSGTLVVNWVAISTIGAAPAENYNPEQ